MLKNKKGSLQDILFVGIVLLVGSMFILFGFKIMSSLNDEIQTNNVIDAQGKAASATLTGHYSGAIDNSFLLLAIGMALVTLVLAALVRVHPVFIAFYFIGLMIVIFVSGILSNIYQELAANSNLSVQADQLVFVSNILEYLPLFVAIFGILLMVIMYKTWRNEQ